MQPHTATQDSNSQLIRSDFETTRSEFMKLLGSLSEADWGRKSANPAWNVGELMAHMTQYIDVALPMLLKNARQRKAMRLPKFLANYMNVFMARSYARKLSRQTIAQRYEVAHSAALALLDNIKDHEWDLTTCLPDGERVTIKDLFQLHRCHFHEHAQQVRQGLGLSSHA